MPSSETDPGLLDLLILGGGVTGAALAREASLAGLAVALVEKGDFASGTSSKSSKLIHGGQRYLESYELGLVRESCLERAVLSRMAPHLVRPLPFLFPVGEAGAPARPLLSLGLLLYEALAAGRNLGPKSYRRRGDAELAAEAPGLGPPGWTGAYRYFDAQADDCLLTLAFLRDAAARGAALHSYTEALRLLRGGAGSVTGAFCRTAAGRELTISARVTVAALGPWSNVLSRLAGQDFPAFVRPTRGSHFFLPPGRLPLKAAAVLLDTRGRRCYAIPWRGGVLVGTTDEDDASSPDAVAPPAGDRAELLGALRRFFPASAIEERDFAGGFAGLRPIVAAEAGVAPEDASREERITEPLPRLIVSVGGKLTTSRRTARRVLARVLRDLGRRLPGGWRGGAREAIFPLPGGHLPDFAGFRTQVRHRAQESLALSPECADRILEREGSRSLEAIGRMERDRELARPISETMPYTVSDLVWGIEEGFATTADDLLSRRTRLSWECPADAENARERAEELVKKRRRN